MKKKIFNKKGFLLGSETLKIIIAVVCIVFLIALLFSLYYSLTGKEKVKQALESKDKIALEITRMNNGGEFLEQGTHIPNPSGWFVMGFVGEDEKPNLCTGQNCLCICEGTFLGLDPFNLNLQIKKCDKEGACEVVSNLKKFEKIEIEKNGINVLIMKTDSGIEVAQK
jgi:hypothetical protein